MCVFFTRAKGEKSTHGMQLHPVCFRKEGVSTSQEGLCFLPHESLREDPAQGRLRGAIHTVVRVVCLILVSKHSGSPPPGARLQCSCLPMVGLMELGRDTENSALCSLEWSGRSTFERAVITVTAQHRNCQNFLPSLSGQQASCSYGFCGRSLSIEQSCPHL